MNHTLSPTLKSKLTTTRLPAPKSKTLPQDSATQITFKRLHHEHMLHFHTIQLFFPL